ncbi:twin-arginine translocation signal domain-containing protein, partial [Streptomyces sp. MB09-02B]
MSEPLTRRKVLMGMAAMTVAAVVTPALAGPAHAAST